MSIRRMNWIVVASVVLLSGGFTFGVLLPGFRSLEQKRTELSTLSEQAAEDQRRLGNVGELYTTVVQMNEQIQEDRKRLPPERQFGEFLKALSDQFRREGIENYTVQPLPEETLDPTQLPEDLKTAAGISLLPVRITFESNFTQLFTFVRKIEDLPRLSHVKSLKATNDEFSPGRVRAEIVLHAYHKPDRTTVSEKTQ